VIAMRKCIRAPVRANLLPNYTTSGTPFTSGKPLEPDL
jgi:hypothetical protein